MRILAINGSPRSNGSTAKVLSLIAEKFGKDDVDIIDLGTKKISHCLACMSCRSTGECAKKDDMTAIYKKIKESDVLIFSSPVYFGMETGLFKNFLDRMYAIGPRDGKKADIGKVKKGSVILTCGAPIGDTLYTGTIAHLTGALNYFGVSDVSSAILPGSGKDTVANSEQFKKYFEVLETQLK